MSSLITRRESPADIDRIHEINSQAFETAAEAELVDKLRIRANPFLSLVAEVDGEVVGHILFTPVHLDGTDGLKLMGLAPMAVAPAWQNQRIGSALVKAGLDQCRNQGTDAVVVLGHPDYYPRFGFHKAAELGIRSEYEVPDEAFMVCELQEGTLQGHCGTVRYNPAFSET